MLMFSQKELIKKWLHPTNNVNLHFVFHRFSLYRTKMALAHTNYGNYGAIRQNCFKHNFFKFIQMNSPSCSIHFTKLWNQEVSFCTDFFFFSIPHGSMFSYMNVIPFNDWILILFCITKTSGFVTKTILIEQLLWWST